MSRPRKAPLAELLLAWYDRHRRKLPWRAPPGKAPDPYHVWLSEIMLQQTTVAAVGPYFEAFLRRWPRVAALAAADLDDVLHAWQGLGYYARARNLHRCAIEIAGPRGGRFPDSESELLTLPGVGPYTAAAIAAIAFGRRAVVVDGNVERVMARLHAVEEPLPGAKKRLRALADRLTPDARAGDYAQAVMDLGATICTLRSPDCPACPWSDSCAGRAIAVSLPRRAPKPERPLRRAMAFWITRPDGSVLLRRRPERGLLGGMIEAPSTEWRAGPMPTLAEARRLAPVPASDWRRLAGVVEHGFTHFRLELAVLSGRVDGAVRLDGENGAIWCHPDRFGKQALPTVMKKLARHALKHG
ncbi:MAG: A/G-specific adenine glycosylase [Rhodospirillales bacterium]|nr:MAG: A/G-specific adenine glycosylase [Rhodospirillales bacterium]UCH74369.1 MAG: A/G-specific adenine glycosylase [Rhodospirillales bacterium]